MLRCLVFALLWLAAASPLAAQIIPNVNFTAVRQRTTNPASPYYFPKLLERLQQR